MKDYLFQINIGNIRIGNIESSSSLNIGRNFLRDFEGVEKTNQGVGDIIGDSNSLPHNAHLVEDPDVFDVLDNYFGRENDPPAGKE
jgi:hypothetical protein